MLRKKGLKSLSSTEIVFRIILIIGFIITIFGTFYNHYFSILFLIAFLVLFNYKTYTIDTIDNAIIIYVDKLFGSYLFARYKYSDVNRLTITKASWAIRYSAIGLNLNRSCNKILIMLNSGEDIEYCLGTSFKEIEKTLSLVKGIPINISNK